MRARILFAVAAWLLGAATATGGCLMAVSLLGDGFGVNGSSGRQLTTNAVSRALAAAKREHSATPAATPSRAARARPVRRHSHPGPPTPTTPSPTPTPTPAQSAAGAGTLLTSSAGTVVASCESAGTYLLSWSPAQGYGVDQVGRGPATAASVVFDAGTRAVTMQVSCPGGAGSTPVSSTSSQTDDDGSGGGDE